ncbi:GNAT family N-acetyltransferase [Solirubrobacter phytolaccae]|uniref:GNAT family N-acetyltransferase n=1 Tax=Solirubrobacter phytolaccae TaxID=1404360 RepID=A0A9X3NE35_9ACTN|nr:GNAT family N-acetyltransferase [Solirubrobacter phytolaccae]MDA0183534.1 GNAT family N-acetyltransferase [Solirubrobacter phytolaccae]
MTIRPMRVEDVLAVHDLNVLTFEALDISMGVEPPPRPDPAVALPRYRNLATTDPDGAWVAEEDGEVVGVALALRREDVWGLSLLLVRPDRQSSGIGGALLARAHAYAEGARGRIIMASPDPRALRAYSRLGLDLHPYVAAVGTPKPAAPPAGVRVGDATDIPLTETVDRHVRGAARGQDIATLLEMRQTLLIVPERGYAVVNTDGAVRIVAALDDEAAADLLRAALARATGRVELETLTAKQQWAVAVALEAGLELRINSGGAMFTSGDVGTFTPYLPSGAFL